MIRFIRTTLTAVAITFTGFVSAAPCISKPADAFIVPAEIATDKHAPFLSNFTDGRFHAFDCLNISATFAGRPAVIGVATLNAESDRPVAERFVNGWTSFRLVAASAFNMDFFDVNRSEIYNHKFGFTGAKRIGGADDAKILVRVLMTSRSEKPLQSFPTRLIVMVQVAPTDSQQEQAVWFVAFKEEVASKAVVDELVAAVSQVARAIARK